MNNVGPNLRKLRKSNKLSQMEFADRVHVSQSHLSQIEQGKCLPSLETLLAVQEQFACSLDTLVSGRSGEEMNAEAREETALIATLVSALAPHDRKEILEIIKLKLELNRTKPH